MWGSSDNLALPSFPYMLHILMHVHIPCVALLAVQKQLELADKYKELKRTGKLDKYLTKKRKRNAKRDRRQLPFKREQ